MEGVGHSPLVLLTKSYTHARFSRSKATYHDLAPPGSPRPVVTARIWSYENPTPSFQCIKDHFCFYCDPRSDAQKDGTWICVSWTIGPRLFTVVPLTRLPCEQKVADEVAKAQEGDFYGSWVTSWISGGPKGFKGGESVDATLLIRWLNATTLHLTQAPALGAGKSFTSVIS
jgi:Domain of unknown function (DUF427)